jgi:hypothetical protein
MARWVPWSLLLPLLAQGLLQAQPPLAEVQLDGPGRALAWSPDGKRLAAGGEGGALVVLDMPGGKQVCKLTPGGTVGAVAFSPDGKFLGVKSGAADGPLSVWDLATQKQLKNLAFAGYIGTNLAFSADGQTLVCGGPGEHMVWNHGKGGGYGSRSGNIPPGTAAAVGAQGQITAWVNPQGQMQVYEIEARKFSNLKIEPALALAFSPDAKHLAAAAPDKTIRLLAMPGGAVERKFEGLRDPATLLHFSANGKVLAAASPGDPVVRLWDVASGRLRRRLTTNPVGVKALAVSPDGLSLALTSGQRVYVWNVATRELGDLGPALKLAPAELKAFWDDLASVDHAKADKAFRQLAAAQEHGLAFLKEQMRAIAAPPVDWQRVDQLIGQLDNPMYPIRQKASQELAKLGEFTQMKLEKYLATQPALEGERRAKKLLERLIDPELTPDRLRCLEAIEILEILKTKETRAVLEEIARDGLMAQIRLAAREALQRLGRDEPKAKDGKKA